MFVFFCIAGIYYSIKEKKSDLVLSSIYWSLAIFTKQTGLIVLLSSIAFLLAYNFSKTVIRIMIIGLTSLLFYVICASLWGEWFNYFIFYLPTFHKTLTDINEISTAVLQLILPLIIAVMIGLSPFLLDRNMWSKQSPKLYYGFMTCVMFGLSLLGRLNLGGYTNVYMPAHIMTAVMFGIGIHWWKGKFQTNQKISPSLLIIALYGICASQFLSVYFDPRLVIPHPLLAQRWSNLESLIRTVDGDVLAPEINYLTSFAGGKPFANQVAVEEIFGKYGNPESVQRDSIQGELSRDLHNRRFRFILLKDRDGAWAQINEYYQCFPFSSSENASNMPPVIVQDYTICFP
jgi:hypothetical protein